MGIYDAVRPCLFCLAPEQAHHIALHGLRFGQRFLPSVQPPKQLAREVMGLPFRHPIGLAAGFDKNAIALQGLAQIGFSHIEVGTVTPQPQIGNSLPRLFRIPEARAIINRMGFNNDGVIAIARRLENKPDNIILGVNIGKNKETPIEQAVIDYLFCYRVIYPLADYVTVNISSPNTQQLRELQTPDALKKLLESMKNAQAQLQSHHKRYVPIAIKIAPDLHSDEIALLSQALNQYQVDAVVATNTTIDKTAVVDSPYGQESGGLSGVPLQAKSTAIIARLREHLDDTIPIIGVGGIADVRSAQEKLMAGASLLQLYTSLVYQGPEVLARIIHKLSLEEFL